jgi:hypothetical protein
MKESLFAFSSEDLRPYFPLMPVLEGVFEHFSKLFNLRFKENKAYPVWHSDVKAFDVYDITDGAFMGTLYGDFFPRGGKKNGAWKTSYRSQGLFHGKLERPVIAIVCNFTKPTKDKPSLLTHDEVLTRFHEMGHAIHALLSTVTYKSLSGTSVLWDFVELPSQVQENWAYTRETLDLFARHYSTGEKIPEDLIRKLNDAKNFMVGWSGLRQTSFGILDMKWHLADPDTIDEVTAFEDKATEDTRLFPRLAGSFLPPNVYYAEVRMKDGRILRCKYNVMRLDQFERAAAGKSPTAQTWARFAQPVRIVFARDADSRAQAVRALAQCVTTFHRHFGAAGTDARSVWTYGLSETYRDEWRSERGNRPGLIFDAAPDAFEERTNFARQQAAAQTGPGLPYSALRPLRKTIAFIRLMKASLLFEGGVDYALWKIGRHSGVHLTATDFQRRCPLIGAWPLLWELYRRGALK